MALAYAYYSAGATVRGVIRNSANEYADVIAEVMASAAQPHRDGG